MKLESLGETRRNKNFIRSSESRTEIYERCPGESGTGRSWLKLSLIEFQMYVDTGRATVPLMKDGFSNLGINNVYRGWLSRDQR